MTIFLKSKQLLSACFWGFYLLKILLENTPNSLFKLNTGERSNFKGCLPNIGYNEKPTLKLKFEKILKKVRL